MNRAGRSFQGRENYGPGLLGTPNISVTNSALVAGRGLNRLSGNMSGTQQHIGDVLMRENRVQYSREIDDRLDNYGEDSVNRVEYFHGKQEAASSHYEDQYDIGSDRFRRDQDSYRTDEHGHYSQDSGHYETDQDRGQYGNDDSVYDHYYGDQEASQGQRSNQMEDRDVYQRSRSLEDRRGQRDSAHRQGTVNQGLGILGAGPVINSDYRTQGDHRAQVSPNQQGGFSGQSRRGNSQLLQSRAGNSQQISGLGSNMQQLAAIRNKIQQASGMGANMGSMQQTSGIGGNMGNNMQQIGTNLQQSLGLTANLQQSQTMGNNMQQLGMRGNMQQGMGVNMQQAGGLSANMQNAMGLGTNAQQGSLLGLPSQLMMEKNLIQLQQQEAAVRETQLQLVNKMLQQQNRAQQGNQTFGGQGLLGNPKSSQQGILGNFRGRRGRGGQIPSLLDINTDKTGGKRGFSGNQKDYSPGKRQRMNSNSQGRNADRRNDNNRGRFRDRRSGDRHRSTSKDSNSSTPRTQRRESGSATEEEKPKVSQEKTETLDIPDEKYDPEKPTEDLEVIDTDVYHDNSTQGNEMETKADVDTQEVMDEGEGNKTDDSISQNEDSANNTAELTDSGKKKTNFFCHVCNVECRDAEGFGKHMKGAKHRNRMESVMGLHKEKSIQLVSRIKAEEHLRKIESSQKDEDQRRNDDRRRSRDGRDRHSWNTFRRPFPGPIRHRGALNQGDHQRRRRSDESENFPDIGDLVTVDTVGFEDESVQDTESTEGRESRAAKKEPEKSTSNKPEISTKPHIPSKPEPTKTVAPAVPPYDANKAFGQSYIVPVSGFYCKLCHKFYNNESAAKESHCKSRSHYDRFKAAFNENVNKEGKSLDSADLSGLDFPQGDTGNDLAMETVTSKDSHPVDLHMEVSCEGSPAANIKENEDAEEIATPKADSQQLAKGRRGRRGRK